jgi:broad specificity phosphatase PhoE
MRRRLYLMRHAEVAYFDEGGRPVVPDTVGLTAAGLEQARAAAEALAGIAFDRVVSSGLQRTVETARLVADVEPEAWPDFRELRAGNLSSIPDEEVEAAFLRAFHGVVPEEARFLGGESIGELLDRVLPALERLAAEDWDTALAVLHGGVNRAILSHALTGHRTFLGPFEQAPACINVLDRGEEDWIVRAVNVTPYDPVHRASRATTMEELYAQYAPYRRGGSHGP